MVEQDQGTVTITKYDGAYIDSRPVDAGDFRLILEMGLNRCAEIIDELQGQVALPSVWAETREEAEDRIVRKLDEVYDIAIFHQRMTDVLHWFLRRSAPQGSDDD